MLRVLAVVLALLPSLASAGDDRFGVAFISPPGQVASAARLDQARDLGAGWDRHPLYWNEVQPSPNGPYDFSRFDAAVAADASRGIKMQGILLGAPDWAKSGGSVDMAAWGRFVGAAVRHFKGRVGHWEIWNEPDLLDGEGKGRYWQWGVAEYARLLKAGYFAAKEADPGTTVLMAGLAMPYNNEGFFAALLAELAKDNDAPRYGWYFDVLPVHVYDRAARVFELPHGYVGWPSFPGYHALMKRRGFDKPIWVNELGVPVWDHATGQKAPGRATQDEQAAFVTQAFAYGLAAGNDRHLFFQLYDDGAGAVDPVRGVAEFFGLVANDGRTRPAYRAYRNAVDITAGARLATRVNVLRAPKRKDPKGVEIISLWGTTRGRVTIAWNAEGGPALDVRVPAVSPTAQLFDKFGQSRGSIGAQDGAFTVRLPGATNNNNFDCFTPRGCDPEDFVIGGDPMILVEADTRVPAVAIERLPSASAIPFRVGWSPTVPSTPGALYDVEYIDMTADATDAGWRTWLTGTAQTSAAFGGETTVQRDHVYAFRVRQRGGAWPAVPLASTFVYGGDTWPPPKPDVDAKIEIVWPHGNAPVERADRANVAVNVFQAGTLTSVGPSWSAPPRLWRAIDNGVEEPVGLGRVRMVDRGGLKYPIWEINDVDVSAARDPRKKVFFRLSMDGKREASNVWSHGVDGRTFMPQPDQVASTLLAMPAAVAAKIEIVWPHGNAPVDRAEKVNVVAYLLENGSNRSVPAAFDGQVVLHRSLNNGPGAAVALGDRELRTINGVTFPAWTFNDVDVSAARDRRNKYYFRLEVGGGVPFYSNVWAHASDARTFVPQPDVPKAVAP